MAGKPLEISNRKSDENEGKAWNSISGNCLHYTKYLSKDDRSVITIITVE
jgi:hypothetical protein